MLQRHEWAAVGAVVPPGPPLLVVKGEVVVEPLVVRFVREEVVEALTVVQVHHGQEERVLLLTAAAEAVELQVLLLLLLLALTEVREVDGEESRQRQRRVLQAGEAVVELRLMDGQAGEVVVLQERQQKCCPALKAVEAAPKVEQV